MKGKKSFLNYIHLFRGLAIVVIVGIHCRISLPWSGDSALSRSILTTLLDNGTVLFVFIAGFLFQYLIAKYEFTSYFKRKIKYVILPYIIVSIPVFIYKYVDQPFDPVWMPAALEESNYLIQCLYMLVTGKHLGPFWFIPMVFLFYLVSPLLVKLDNAKFYQYGFPVLFLLGLFTFRFGYYSNTLDSFIHYIPIYIFGMWGAAYRDKITGLKAGWVVFLCAIYISIATSEVLGYIEIPKLTSFSAEENLPYFHFNFAKLKVSILCLILIRIFYYFNDNEISLLKKLADDSFGIYFLHMYVITAVEIIIFSFYPEFKLTLTYFIIYTVMVTIGSILIIEVTKMLVGKKSRMLIGS